MNVVGSTKAFKWEGVKELQKVFQTMAEMIGPDGMGDAREQLKDAFMPPALAIRDEAKDLAPIRAQNEKGHHEPPGTLRSAILATKGRSDIPGVVVYVDKAIAPYAGFVERGTSKMAAQPFFRPAINAVRPLVANMMADGLKRLIEEKAQQLAYHP
jgi:HK97 gp10 family phage protein